MEALINSMIFIFIGEMGDKTQLLSLVLVTRYRRPWVILFAIFWATILNHALASFFGVKISEFLSPQYLKIILSILFFGFSIWVLFPDKIENDPLPNQWGVFGATFIAFFIAEMGDKTQLLTIALAAQYVNGFLVTIGSTLGILLSNALVIFGGRKLLLMVPLKWIRIFASLLFLLFGVSILVF